MKEKPILLNSEMIRAVLDGRKTQSRRIVQSPAKNMQASGQKVIDYREPGDKWYGEHVFSMRNQSGTWCDYTKEQFLAKCPFGAVGDRLWVRESYRMPESLDRYSPQQVADLAIESGYRKPWAPIQLEADGVRTGKWNGFDTPPMVTEPGKLRPSIHMPRWASRITLEITGVRVERLNSISEADAKAEGIKASKPWSGLDGCVGSGGTPAAERFESLWQSIYGVESWQANPWVWVIEFKRVGE